jgi:protein-L-isoaspartate O-methyltransferase
VSTPIGYFEDMYARNPDPWSFETRWYEERKHALTVDALAQRRYRSAFEPGCSTGMLTSLLAARCDHLLAVDAIEAAACTAAKRVADRPHVTVRPPGCRRTGHRTSARPDGRAPHGFAAHLVALATER